MLGAGLETLARVYTVNPNGLVCTYTHSLTVRAFKFFPTSDKLAFAYDGNDLRIISAVNCSVLNTLLTGHGKNYGVDFNKLGTKMLTCGDDKTFRVWDITVWPYVVIGGGFVTSTQPIWSCQFAYDEHVLIGLANANVMLYGPSFVAPALSTFVPTATGIALNVKFFFCENAKFIMGSDNHNGYVWNNTSPLFSSSNQVRFVDIDTTNSFLAYGTEGF